MEKGKLIQRVDELIELAEKVLATKLKGMGVIPVDHGQFHGFRSAALSFIGNLYGTDHIFYTDFITLVLTSDVIRTETGKAILESIKGELIGDWLISIKGSITAEVFSDFLEMADYFLAEGYKDPGAVMIGGVLEEHLRQLCQKSGIEIEIESKGRLRPKRANTLNSELVKAEAYNKLEQQNITAWLALRNNAAHGKYDEYTKEQVTLMLQGVTEFISRVTI